MARRLRHLPAGIAVLALVALVLSGTTTAASRPCGDRVLDDWADGRIDGVYAPECYAAALASLPEDLRAYSSAQEDIERALRRRLTGEAPRPDTAQAPAPAPASEAPTTTRAAAPKRTLAGPGTTRPADTVPAVPSGSHVAAAQPPEPAEADASPWPLALALLAAGLLLAGSVPVVRRLRAR
ncbi:MAG TPA: hypothetical protein VLB86_04095 [Gaiellaceae bacterium]|nr:hypothetical protein [Gaiellaceae bacterium]